MTNDLIKIIVIILLLCGVFYGGYYLGNKVNVQREIQTIEYSKIDTCYQEKIIEHSPIKIFQEGKIVYIRDTIIESKPFVASIDSVMTRDTIKVSYAFPQNRFDIDLHRMPDTVHTKILILNKTTECPPEPWYIKPIYAGAGLLIGFGLGRL